MKRRVARTLDGTVYDVAGSGCVGLVRSFLSPVLISDRFNTSNAELRDLLPATYNLFTERISDQVANGAQAFDLCAAASGKLERRHLWYLVRSTRHAIFLTGALLSIDTSDPNVLEGAADHRRPVILNCYSGALPSPNRMLESIAAFQHVVGIIAVCIDTHGSNVTPQHRLDIAKRMADELATIGIPPEKIIFDPVTMPSSCGEEAEAVTHETARLLREAFPTSSVLSAVSNYSYGLEKRRKAEREYVRRAKTSGATVFLLNAMDATLCAIARGDE